MIRYWPNLVEKNVVKKKSFICKEVFLQLLCTKLFAHTYQKLKEKARKARFHLNLSSPLTSIPT